MNIQIRYYTRSGNTKRLAEAIAEGTGAECASVDCALSEKADLLFLGCSYYAFDMDASVKSFLSENKDKIGKIVIFGTSAMMKSMKKPMKKVTNPLGLSLSEEEFHCRGEFKMFFKGKPDEEDLAKAKEFAKKVIEGNHRLTD